MRHWILLFLGFLKAFYCLSAFVTPYSHKTVNIHLWNGPFWPSLYDSVIMLHKICHQSNCYSLDRLTLFPNTKLIPLNPLHFATVSNEAVNRYHTLKMWQNPNQIQTNETMIRLLCLPRIMFWITAYELAKRQASLRNCAGWPEFFKLILSSTAV